MNLHQVLKWWPLVVVGGLGLIGYGSMQTEIANLKDRIGKVEDRVDPLRQLRVGKGDLCLKLIEQYGSVKDSRRQSVLLRKWGETGCGEVSAAAMEMVNAVEDAPPPQKPQPQQ